MKIGIKSQGPPRVTTIVPSITDPILIQPNGPDLTIPISQVLDQRGKDITDWAVSTDNAQIASATRTSTGIVITCGIIEGDCNLLINP